MKRMKLWGAVMIIAVLMLNPEETVSNAQRAMRIWYSSVAPTLFPFLVLMPMLTSREACMAYKTIFSRWMRPLFRLSGSAAPAVIAGLIAGSPGGAMTLQRVAASSDLTHAETRRIALAMGGVSPAYLVMGVGQGLYGSVSVGIRLAIAQACVQLLLLALLPDLPGDDVESFRMDEAGGYVAPIAAAVEAILGICGYMVFYSVVAGGLTSLIGRGIGDYLLLMMDLPSGLGVLAGKQISIKWMLQGAAVGFTGLCIISQNMNVLREMGIKWSSYLGIRLVSAAGMALSGLVMQGEWKPIEVNLQANLGKSYAFSLLTVGISMIPGLIFLTKKLFLNKRRDQNF